VKTPKFLARRELVRWMKLQGATYDQIGATLHRLKVRRIGYPGVA
jgi:hypothetical protein